VISYRATPDVPRELLCFVTRLLITERRLRGTPAGSRALTCREQAILVLRRFRDRTRSSSSAVTTASPAPPPTSTSARAPRSSPLRLRTCTRPWSGLARRALPSCSWTGSCSPPTACPSR
jgi:hypothetical protein